MYDLNNLRENSESISEYILTSSKDVPGFKENAAKYEPDKEVISKLKRYKGDIVVFVFSAEWCPDCQRHIPVLGLIAESTGIEVNVFGHLMRDPKRPKGYWQIPPSPPEAEDFAVRKIPSIVVLDNGGKKVGDIIENPPEGKTLEKALLDILIRARTLPCLLVDSW